MTIVFAFVVLFSCLSFYAHAVCETFSKTCTISIGQRLPLSENSNYAYISADENFYVTFSMPLDIQSVYMDLSVLFGTVRMYASLNRKPSPTDFDYTNALTGQQEYLSMVSSSHKASDKFNVLIKASPSSAAQFTGAVVAANRPVAVELNGMPQAAHMGRGSLQLFRFSAQSNAPINVIATGFSSYMPIMTLFYYPATNGPAAVPPQEYFNSDNDPNNHYLSFTPKSTDIDKVFEVQLHAVNMSSISLVARVGAGAAGEVITGTPAQDPPMAGAPTHTVVLQSGHPQRDLLGVQQEHYYVFYVPPGITGKISINVDPLQGDSDLFVNPSSRGFYHHGSGDPFPTWSSMRASGIDSVVIRKEDRDYLHTGGAYYITVFGYEAAQFMIRVNAQDAATLLVEGYSVQDTVAKGSYKYFRFQDSDPLHSVYFDLLPTVGDADLMVGCILSPTGGDDGYPSKLSGHYNYSSQMYMEDTVVVSPSDAQSCSLGANADSSAHRGEGGMFYLAVYGYSDATFMISAQHAFGERTLVDGLPVSAVVYRLVPQRFKIRVGFQAEELRLRLTPLFGDADLYASLNKPPEMSNYDFQSSNFNSEADTIVIPEDQICANCWVHVLVYGFVTTEFTLLASFSDATVVLSNGVPQRGSVASNAVEYYNYVATADSSLTVVITASNGHVPALYMSNSVERPNSTTPDTVIRKADSGFGVLPKVVLPDVVTGSSVHIGVAGAGKNITYSIRVHETATAAGALPTLLMLVDGAPQEDSIPSDSATGWLYYQVNAPIGHETIRLRAVMEVGFIELYVIKCTTSVFQCASSGLPDETNYLLTTADTDRDFLNIYRNDDEPALYIVGVLSRSYYAVYQLSAGFESSALSLQAGVAVMDHVNKNEVDYFSFYLDQSYVKLKISITTMSGDPDLFVSTTVERPAADDRNSTWRSTEFGSDVLTIDPQLDPRACVRCTYYIAVVGRQESTYTIAASTTSNLPKLVDGVPTAGSIAQGEWAYYSFQNKYGSSRDLHVGLTSATGNADLYVSLDGTIPSFSNSQYSSANWFSNDGVDILHTDPAYSTSCSSSTGASDCVVVLGVYGFAHSEYTLILTSSSAATLLQLGVVQSTSVAQAQNKNYRVLLSAGGSLSPYTLRFSVTPLSGHVQLFVSCDNFQPNATSHQWAMTPTPGSGSTLDIMSVSAVDKGCLKTGAQYYAAVYGDSASSFTISANLVNSTSVPLLIPGFSHSGILTAHSFDYYFLRPGASFEDIRLLATVLQGDVDIYVSATWDTRPKYSVTTGRVQSYLLSSTKSGSEDMVLSHDWVQDVCDQRDSCYLIVGVLGKAASSSRYSILSTSQDATLQLSEGVPRQSHVKQGRLEYFKFTLSQPELDVIVSVTPISGDPDLFIGMQPLTHPSRDNFTWFQSKFGADSITLQYREISQHCVPRPLVTGGDCDIYIGVYGWMNTTFTIMAAADEGFRSPVTLIDQNPQTGFVGAAAYTYYRYAVSVPPGGSGSPPVNIKFTLTPTDDGDADLFLLIEPNGNKTEPGLTNYNYRSVGWGSVTESIELSADMPFYCFDCTVYLAVYGYRPCTYSIQASSSGLVALQAGQAIGGHVNSEQFAYYTIHNSNQFGLMKFTLTMISEDADLYILPHKPDTAFTLPTRSHYQWRSLFVGSDVVSLTYEDPHYCTDCDYIVGVYGYANSTYTLMVTDQEDGIVKLVQNRPQIAAIGTKDGMLYFSAVVASSNADMTVTLTSLDTGYADLYVQVYNASVFNSAAGGDVYRLPDPDVPSSYSYTTHGSEDDHVFIRGPHKHESVVVVAVRALRPVRFSIVVTSSQTPVLLLAGVPQSHYVEFGMNEYFKFYPHADEDLHITLTARSGDPDLLVSASSSTPHCARVATTYYTSTVCSNFTWSSRSYMTDQLIISRDSPCSAVMPGTSVAADCDPAHSYLPHSGAPVFIGVYGYSAAQFNILVAPVGQQLQLLAGQPQQSRTSSGYICSSRSPSNGACTTPSSANKKVEVAYFAFRVPFSSSDSGKRQVSADLGNLEASSSVQSVFDVIFTIVPSCNTSRLPENSEPAGQECAPGCDCAPLIAYINSCPLSRCSQVDRKPSELFGQHKVAHIVKAGMGSTIFLSSAGAGGTSSLCDPAVAGEDCGYFMAVVASPLPSTSPNSAPRLESAVFTITARTPGDMTLIPCVADTGSPDGIQFFGEDSINLVLGTGGKQQRGSGPTHHYYELCSQQYAPEPSAPASSESLIVELEQCAGTTSLYACADSGHCTNAVPTQQSWGYFSDETQTCVHSWDPWGRDTCISVVRSRPSLSLPQRLGNYFLMANGSGKFEMRVQTTVGGVKVAPQVIFAGMQSVDSARVKILDVTGNTVRMQWQQARVLMPGMYIPLEADYMTYSAYIFDAKLTNKALNTLQVSQGVDNVRFTTLCGLNYAAEVLPVNTVKVERARLKSVDQGADFMADTFEGLAVNTQYRLVLVAACDSTCLRQLSKVTNNPRISISCSDRAGDCKPQSVVYISSSFTTAATPDDVSHDDVPSSGDNSSYVRSLINFSIVVMVLLGIALIGVVAYWLKYNGNETWTVASAWLHNNVGGGIGASWLGEGEDRVDMSSARSSHGLVSSSSGSSSTVNRQFSGYPALSQVKFGTGKKPANNSNSNNQEGVELETLSYAPPSISGRENHSSSRSGASMEPIDFRSSGSAVDSVSEAVSGAAAKIYSTVTGTTAVNPVHRTTTAGYVGLSSDAGAVESSESTGDEENELHL